MADIRWRQRLENYKSALDKLSRALQLANTRELTELEKQGLSQAFECTHELAWNVLKDYVVYLGNVSITGSRGATREAFKMGIIKSDDTWMEMIQSRKQTSHTYNRVTADDISKKVVTLYHAEFKQLEMTLSGL